MSKPDFILSFGHGTASQAQITDLLHGVGTEILVDVRSFPGSRRHPYVNKESLAQWIPQAGIEYLHMPELGGFRKHCVECEKDIVWQNASFRNYAGYTRSLEFLAGIERLLAMAEQKQLVYMCSETVWWRCHRRIISDFLVVARGMDVRHLMHDGRITQHKPTEGIRLREDGLVVYDQPTATSPQLDLFAA
ncbi:MAG: DUF488 domain-containing protein [Paralcaligenes sp.]